MNTFKHILLKFPGSQLRILNFSSADHVPSSKVFVDYFGVITISFESLDHNIESLTFYSIESGFNKYLLKLNHKDLGKNDYLTHKSHAIFGDGSIKFRDFFVSKIACYQVLPEYELGNDSHTSLEDSVNLLVLQSVNNQLIGIMAIEGEDQGESSISIMLGDDEISLDSFTDQFCGKKGYSREYGNFVEVPKLLFQVSD